MTMTDWTKLTRFGAGTVWLFVLAATEKLGGRRMWSNSKFFVSANLKNQRRTGFWMNQIE